MRIGCWVAIAALLVAGCGAKEDAAPEPDARETLSVADPSGDAPSEAPPEVQAVDIKVENDLYDFFYAYPAEAAAIAGVKDVLDARMQEVRGKLIADATADKKGMESRGFPYRAHSYRANWQVVADLPDWLSLSADIYTFSGGAHGMSTFDSKVWDRKAELVREPSDLFASKAALSAALRERFCAALDVERAKRRGGQLNAGGEDTGEPLFSDCIDPVDQTVLLGSSNGATFDRIGLIVPPYNAGPYAEGSYEITLPVDGAVMRALRPQYRSGFSIPE